MFNKSINITMHITFYLMFAVEEDLGRIAVSSCVVIGAERAI